MLFVCQGGGFGLLGIQVAGVVSITAWTAVTSFICLIILNLTVGIRVSLQRELLGADVVEHSIGDIDYDKIEGKVTSFRRQSQGQGFGSEVLETIVPSGNLEEKGLQKLAFMNDQRKRSRRKSLGKCFPSGNVYNMDTECETDDNVPAQNGGIPTVSSANMEQDVVNAHLEARSRSADKKANLGATLWKYAVGRVLNDDEKARRKQLQKNILAMKGKAQKLAPNGGEPEEWPSKAGQSKSVHRNLLNTGNITRAGHPSANAAPSQQDATLVSGDQMLTRDKGTGDNRNSKVQAPDSMIRIRDGGLIVNSNNKKLNDSFHKNSVSRESCVYKISTREEENGSHVDRDSQDHAYDNGGFSSSSHEVSAHSIQLNTAYGLMYPEGNVYHRKTNAQEDWDPYSESVYL